MIIEYMSTQQSLQDVFIEGVRWTISNEPPCIVKLNAPSIRKIYLRAPQINSEEDFLVLQTKKNVQIQGSLTVFAYKSNFVSNQTSKK